MKENQIAFGRMHILSKAIIKFADGLRFLQE